MKSFKRPLLILFLVFALASASCAHKEIVSPEAMAPPLPLPKPAKIALVLGAGSAKGFAHIGVLKVLETNNIPIHMIVGASAGSVVGSFYAAGIGAFELQRLATSVDKGDIVDLVFPDNGFIKGERLAEFVGKHTGGLDLEHLRIPFYAVATDIQTGNEIVFGRGNTGTAVRASSSVPGVFRPVKIGERLFVDGAVVSPVPVDAARRYGADIVIAVDITSDVGSAKPESTMETILQTIQIMNSKLAFVQCSKAEVLIRPRVGHIGAGDFTKRHEAILEGEKAAVEALPRIREIVDKLKSEGRLQ
jgi:NTE family protein